MTRPKVLQYIAYSFGGKLPDSIRPGCAMTSRVTNQPNRVFLRSWREALEVPTERHRDTFDGCGNLFAAGIPVNLDRAITLPTSTLVGRPGTVPHTRPHTAGRSCWRTTRRRNRLGSELAGIRPASSLMRLVDNVFHGITQ